MSDGPVCYRCYLPLNTDGWCDVCEDATLTDTSPPVTKPEERRFALDDPCTPSAIVAGCSVHDLQQRWVIERWRLDYLAAWNPNNVQNVTVVPESALLEALEKLKADRYNPDNCSERCDHSPPPVTKQPRRKAGGWVCEHPESSWPQYYTVGEHWLRTAYERICAGEPEADVLRDYGWAEAGKEKK